MRFILSLVATAWEAAAVYGGDSFVDSVMHELGYSLHETIGEGKWAQVYRVTDAAGVSRALRVDKEPTGTPDGHLPFNWKEYHVFRALEKVPDIGPQLHKYFQSETACGQGVRFWIMDLLGPTLRAQINSRGPFGEHEAMLVVQKVIRSLSKFHEAGYLHNDIHYDNVAFARESTTNPEDVRLIDYGNVSLIPSDPYMPPSVEAEFGVEKVLRDYVLRAYPGTDQSWFRRIIQSHDTDDNVRDFIKTKDNWLSWSPEARIAIRNSRIFERLVPTKKNPTFSESRGWYSSTIDVMESAEEIYTHIIIARERAERIPNHRMTEKKWFMWALLEADEDSSITSYLQARQHQFGDVSGLILATRGLAQYIHQDLMHRREYARVVQLYLELVGAGIPESRDPSHSWFWKLMSLSRQSLAGMNALNGYAITNVARGALLRAWDVMHGKEPDYAKLAMAFGMDATTAATTAVARPYAEIESVYVEEPVGAHRATIIYLQAMSSSAEQQVAGFRSKGFFGPMGEGIRVVAPKIRATSRNPKMEWFPYLVDPATYSPPYALGSPEVLNESLNSIIRVVDEEAARLGGDFSRIFVVGWSKGAMMAAYTGVMANRGFGGVLVHLGAYPLMAGAGQRPSDKGSRVPIYQVHDRDDTIVNQSWATGGRDAIYRRAKGYGQIEWINISGETHHGLTENSLAYGAHWIAERLPSTPV